MLDEWMNCRWLWIVHWEISWNDCSCSKSELWLVWRLSQLCWLPLAFCSSAPWGSKWEFPGSTKLQEKDMQWCHKSSVHVFLQAVVTPGSPPPFPKEKRIVIWPACKDKRMTTTKTGPHTILNQENQLEAAVQSCPTKSCSSWKPPNAHTHTCSCVWRWFPAREGWAGKTNSGRGSWTTVTPHSVCRKHQLRVNYKNICIFCCRYDLSPSPVATADLP